MDAEVITDRLLVEVYRHGGNIKLEDAKLVLYGGERIPPELKANLKENKGALIRNLSADKDQLMASLEAAADGLPITSHDVYKALDPGDIAAWRYGELSGDNLRALALVLNDGIARCAGRVPEHETAVIYCRNCGPVWTAPDIAECLPVDGGWPRALGCPWCLPKSRSFLRPSVCCEGCRHFGPDSINPPAGLGSCSAGHGVYYPKQAHVCPYFQPDISED